MVQYSGLRFWKDAGVRARTIERLLALRAGIAEKISPSNKQESFHLATWNIRDFGAAHFNPSPRSDEALLYIAEIISAFDLVAIQEVNENLTDFDRVMRLLGPHWSYVVTDQGGNDERLAFAFDTRKILFRRMAGEIVLPPVKGKPVAQFNRTPFVVAFQAGWFKFNLCTVHIYYGSSTDTKKRQQEIADIAAFFTKRQKKDGESYILLGDFNIVSPDDANMAALLGHGFKIPPGVSKPSALASAATYDQIALRTENRLFEVRASGCFRWQDYIFRGTDDYAAYKPQMPTTTKSGKPAKTDITAYRKWRTWQISDHLPLWVEIKTDFTDDYLQSLKTNAPLAEFAPTTGPRISASGKVD
jgi:endonuclease/exonuclease/phosphatase family metal-dependent hydrolase